MTTNYNFVEHVDLLSGLESVLRHASDEYLLAIHFSASGEVLKKSVTCNSSKNQVSLPYREIVRDGLALDTSALVLVHNHPSGDPSPSQSDIRLTHRFADILAAVSIRLEDHLILTRNQTVSMKALQLI